MRLNALVAFRNRPAVVKAVGERIHILTESGEKRVREKDLFLLHPGPAELPLASVPAPDLAEVYEVLEGEPPLSFSDFLALVFPEASPAEAWALYRALLETPWFRLEAGRVVPRPRAEAERLLARAAREAAERARFAAAIERFREGRFSEEDRALLAEVERLALGRAKGSGVLRALGRKETPEEAHALLLELGYWSPYVNPYPARFRLPVEPPQVPWEAPDDEERVDLTDLPAYAIDDDPASGDADDAIACREGEILVHVADVAAWVAPDSLVDRAARERGSALYLPERVVPMLPEGLVEAAALGRGEQSRALTFAFRLEGGEPLAVRVFPSWVRIERLSYREAEERLREPPFSGLLERAEAFYQRRLENGALDLALPEVKVRVEAGRVEIRPLSPYRSRFLVRELMLAAGEAAARYAGERGIPFPYATQEKRPFEGPLPEDPLARSYAARRLLTRTTYRKTALLHAGLGLSAYAQVTSPLRRYLDLVAHQQLRAHLKGRAPLAAEAVLERVGQAEAVADAVRSAERASRTHFKLVWLLERPDYVAEGVVVELRGSRAVFFLPELALETSLARVGDERIGARFPLRLASVDLPRLSAAFSRA